MGLRISESYVFINSSLAIRRAPLWLSCLEWSVHANAIALYCVLVTVAYSPRTRRINLMREPHILPQGMSLLPARGNSGVPVIDTVPAVCAAIVWRSRLLSRGLEMNYVLGDALSPTMTANCLCLLGDGRCWCSPFLCLVSGHTPSRSPGRHSASLSAKNCTFFGRHELGTLPKSPYRRCYCFITIP